jgi:hypothetical protein
MRIDTQGVIGEDERLIVRGSVEVEQVLTHEREVLRKRQWSEREIQDGDYLRRPHIAIVKCHHENVRQEKASVHVPFAIVSLRAAGKGCITHICVTSGIHRF